MDRCVMCIPINSKPNHFCKEIYYVLVFHFMKHEMAWLAQQKFTFIGTYNCMGFQVQVFMKYANYISHAENKFM